MKCFSDNDNEPVKIFNIGPEYFQLKWCVSEMIVKSDISGKEGFPPYKGRLSGKELYLSIQIQ
jgi:hypothetical protein